MRKYELALVMRPSLKEADRKKFLETIKEQLGKVKIAKQNDWGQKALAYVIKKEDAGYYIMLELEAEDPKGTEQQDVIPADFETRLIRNDSVIRHLLLRTK
jgi:small subunit ribosomal protein S6